MHNKIYFDFKGKVVTLPVNPEELWIKYNGNNESVDMIQTGEVNFAKNKKLATIEIASFFPEDTQASYVISGSNDPEFYIVFLKQIQDSKKPFRFIISGTDINQEMLIESFEYGYAGGCNDVEYKLSLKEYKPIIFQEVKLIEDRDSFVDENTSRPEPANKEVTVGCSVIVNGQVHRDSYGGGPGITLSNFNGIINFVNQAGSKPYHVTNQSGGWLGWVSADSVEVI